MSWLALTHSHVGTWELCTPHTLFICLRFMKTHNFPLTTAQGHHHMEDPLIPPVGSKIFI